MELLRVENITKTYHLGEIDVPVLKGVSFSIQRGEMVALMGASGSGKSTLMNILGCLDRPSSGKYWLDGEEISDLAPNERALVRTAKLGFVFQSFNLLPRTSALNNVLMPLDYSPSAPAAAVAHGRAIEIMDRVGLSDRLEHEPSQMSGGQQQRVAIARSLINEPALVLADEPTGNLDSHTSVEILEMFQQLNKAGITVIIVTHDPKVAAYAHRTIRVVDGLIVEDDATMRVLEHAGAAGEVERQDGALANGDAVTAPAPTGLFAANGSNGSYSNGAHSNGAYSNGNGVHDGGSQASGPHLTQPLEAAGAAVATLATSRTQRRQSVAAATVKSAPEPATEPETTPVLERAVKHHAVASMFPPTLRTAMGALRRNKMRSALTTLGIIIGVAAVIAMVEIGQGSRTQLMQTMATMGTNNVMVRSGAAASGGISWGSGSVITLSPKDAEELNREVTAADAVAPIVQIGGQQLIHGNHNWVPMTVLGTNPAYLVTRDWEELDEGEMFTDADVRNSTKVCVIGKTLVKELFENENPVGQDVRLKNVTLRVVGVLKAKGANMMAMDQDDILITPWTTLKYRIAGNVGGGGGGGAGGGAAGAAGAAGGTTSTVNTLSKLYPGTGAVSLYPQPSTTQQADTPQPVRFANIDQIMVKARSAADVPTAMAEITAILRERHHLRAGEGDDFNLRDMTEMLKTMGSMSQMMGGLLLIVALISLAVGGVGIMNIMLVSVTERTREIGLRMAVGARSHHILRQFLIEAVVLCLLGGFVGILAGRGASTMVWYFLRWPIKASAPAIIAAFVVSATIGIAFGFYPAWKASRLDPIEALRYE